MKLKDLQKNRKKYIEKLVSKSDMRLEKILDAVREQISMAHDQRNTIALDVLFEVEDQIIEARQIKFDKGCDW